MSSHFLGRSASAHAAIASEDKRFHSKCPCSCLPLVFRVELEVIRHGVSLWAVRVSCSSCVPSQPLVWDYWLLGGWKESLDAVQALLSNSQNSKHSTFWGAMRTVSPIPARPSASPVQEFRMLWEQKESRPWHRAGLFALHLNDISPPSQARTFYRPGVQK